MNYYARCLLCGKIITEKDDPLSQSSVELAARYHLKKDHDIKTDDTSSFEVYYYKKYIVFTWR